LQVLTDERVAARDMRSISHRGDVNEAQARSRPGASFVAAKERSLAVADGIEVYDDGSFALGQEKSVKVTDAIHKSLRGDLQIATEAVWRNVDRAADNYLNLSKWNELLVEFPKQFPGRSPLPRDPAGIKKIISIRLFGGAPSADTASRITVAVERRLLNHPAYAGKRFVVRVRFESYYEHTAADLQQLQKIRYSVPSRAIPAEAALGAAAAQAPSDRRANRAPPAAQGAQR